MAYNVLLNVLADVSPRNPRRGVYGGDSQSPPLSVSAPTANAGFWDLGESTHQMLDFSQYNVAGHITDAHHPFYLAPSSRRSSTGSRFLPESEDYTTAPHHQGGVASLPPFSGQMGYQPFHAHTNMYRNTQSSHSSFQSLPYWQDRRELDAPAAFSMPLASPTRDLVFPGPTAGQLMPTAWAHSDNGHSTFARGVGDYSHTVESSHTPNQSPINVLPFTSQSWSDMIMSAMDSSDVAPSISQNDTPPDTFTFPDFSPVSSPSPSPCPYRGNVPQPSHIYSASPTPPASRSHSVDYQTGVKRCSHCQATSTPLWRREPTTLKPLCNACGLYLQQRNKLRPQELIDADADDDESTDGSEKSLVGPECSHCHTRQTSVWRRSKAGAQLCNACGVYSRLRGKDRPLSLKRNKIKPRSKHIQK